MVAVMSQHMLSSIAAFNRVEPDQAKREAFVRKCIELDAMAAEYNAKWPAPTTEPMHWCGLPMYMMDSYHTLIDGTCRE
jgi:hypothetical protein